MLTVGVDLVEISRIERSIRNPRFVDRVFGAQEQKRLHRAESYAAAFAAKEAFAKALGTGVCGFGLAEVEVLEDALGAPYLHLSGRARKLAEDRGLCFALSLTHTGGMAAAVVIAQPAEQE